MHRLVLQSWKLERRIQKTGFDKDRNVGPFSRCTSIVFGEWAAGEDGASCKGGSVPS